MLPMFDPTCFPARARAYVYALGLAQTSATSAISPQTSEWQVLANADVWLNIGKTSANIGRGRGDLMTNTIRVQTPQQIWTRKSLSALMVRAAEARLTVLADGERLVVRGPRDSDATLVQAVLARKAEILAVWRHCIDDNDREQFEERAAIFEYDGGLSRAVAEWLARAGICGFTPSN
jgi:hypothetical protein